MLPSSQPFLPPRAEKQDVHAFLLENLTNGGILELMMRYLKSMGHKFLLRWPPGLTEVVLSIYHSWRRHSTSLPNPLLRDCSNKHIKVWAGASGGLGPGGGRVDLLWVWGCCPIEPARLHPFVGRNLGLWGVMGPGLCLERSLVAEWRLYSEVRVGTGPLEGCCRASDSDGSGVEGSGGRADRMSCRWR